MTICTFYRRCLATLFALVSYAVAAQEAAIDYPNRPVRLITAFGPGSGSDITARRIADQLQQRLGQAVVVENRPGASGQVASSLVARAQPDGYTLMLGTNTTHASNAFLFKELRYDPLKDFTPLARIGIYPFVFVVSGNLPIRTLDELLQYGTANPDKLSYAYGNSTGQIAAAAFSKMTNFPATAIPYKSTPQAMTDVIGERALFMVVDWVPASGLIHSGKLNALAQSPANRSRVIPDTIPTVAEVLDIPQYDLAAYAGIFAPAGIPEPIAQRLSDELYAIGSDPDFQQFLNNVGAEPAPAPAKAFAQYVARQFQVWGEKIQQAGIQPE